MFMITTRLSMGPLILSLPPHQVSFIYYTKWTNRENWEKLDREKKENH